MKKLLILSYLLILVLGMAEFGRASLINGDFGTDDLTGWTFSTGGMVPGVIDGGIYQLGSRENIYGVTLTAGVKNIPTQISQTLFLNAGDQLSGYAKFIGHDYLPYNDYASVKISAGALTYNPWFYAIGFFPQYIDSEGNPIFDPYENPFTIGPRQEWQWVAPASGIYTLSLEVVNIEDTAYNSEAFFDHIQLTGVPIPGAVWLLGSGLIGLTGLRLRRKKKK